MKALVIGGTGPTGPALVNGLLARGFEPVIFHRGTHELPELEDVEHIHGDPHFIETIDDALKGRTFDVVLAMYGRVHLIADYLSGRCGHFVSVAGAPVFRGYLEPDQFQPHGLPIPLTEDSPQLDTSIEYDHPALRFAAKVIETEQAVLRHQSLATLFRYPVIYGPRNPVPWEWSVMKRVQDGRRSIVLPDGGMAIHARCAARNAAEFILRALDRPEIANRQVYHCADDQQFTLRQWVDLIASLMGARLEVVGVPHEMAPLYQGMYSPLSSSLAPHTVFSNQKAREQLGYRDVVAPEEALQQSIEWYTQNPVLQPEIYAGYLDRFDYDLEDRLAAAYREAVQHVLEAAPQVLPTALHGMPHPKQPGLALDGQGR